MGLALGNRYGYSIGGSGGSDFNGTVIAYSYVNTHDRSKMFGLANSAVNLELDLSSIQLGFYTGRSFGLHTTNQLDITYTINSSQPTKGSATSKGQYWCYGLSFKYKLSNLWEKG